MDHENPIVTLFGLDFNVTNTIVTVSACVIVFLIAFICTRNLQIKPTGKQNFIEWVVDFTGNIASSAMSKQQSEKFRLLGFTLLTFVFVSNMMGLP